jgi:hypothetical protein
MYEQQGRLSAAFLPTLDMGFTHASMQILTLSLVKIALNIE